MYLSVIVVLVGYIRIFCGGLKLVCNGNGGSGGGILLKRYRLYYFVFVKIFFIRFSFKLYVVLV